MACLCGIECIPDWECHCVCVKGWDHVKTRLQPGVKIRGGEGEQSESCCGILPVTTWQTLHRTLFLLIYLFTCDSEKASFHFSDRLPSFKSQSLSSQASLLMCWFKWEILWLRLAHLNCPVVCVCEINNKWMTQGVTLTMTPKAKGNNKPKKKTNPETNVKNCLL